ncbi:MAG TPA: molybdopterin cofactor-binding domain-containing protein [Terracidiphilus sp.]|jgi:isoquinoline 1-oxidoreductase beta subunit
MKISRRGFLATSAALGGGAFVIGFHLQAAAQDTPGAVASGANPFDAWIHIKPDSSAELVLAQSEMGQGVFTSLPMLLAEEADLDWARVTIVQSDATKGTGGSGSVRSNYLPLRRAGSQVRWAMTTAAARKWGVPGSECRTCKGEVTHTPSGRRLAYGELAAEASHLRLPDANTVKLKEPSQFTLIGRDTPHLDIPDKCTGKARFGLDVRIPGMVYTLIARCPTFGGSVAKFDASKALAVPGVLQVFEIPARGFRVFSTGGVVVVGKTTWAAMQGRKELEITWNHGPNAGETSELLRAQMQQLIEKAPQWTSGASGPDFDAAIAAKRVEAVYEFPFLAHACMEPMNTTIHLRDGTCEVWSPSQGAEAIRGPIAKELELPESAVTVHTTLMGGGFGRRYAYDFPTEAAQIARRVSSPVQLMWTREDDMTHDFYRPTGMRRMRGALNANGDVVAWSDHLADTAIDAFWSAPGQYKINGSELPPPLPYPVPLVNTGFSLVTSAVPRAWWRSVENSFHGFAVESFIDELAHAAGQDPYQFRKRLLQLPPIPPDKAGGEEGPAPDPRRLVAVLDLAAEKAGWEKPLGKHRGRGIACTTAYAYLAEVAEVTVENDNIQIDRLVMGIDCGQVVNPNGARSQLEGGMLFTMSAVLKEAVTIRNGAAEQQNFDDYTLLRMPEAPAIETYFVDSHAEPHGLGEAAVWLTGPAIANAIFAATGKRLRRMPFRMDET